MHDGNDTRTSRKARTCHTPGHLCEIIATRVDDFPVNTENRRRSRERTRGRPVTKNGETSTATMPQGQRTLLGEGASQGVSSLGSLPLAFLLR